MQRIQLSLAKGANQSNSAKDPSIPESWEYSVFSQNGEDGLIDYLLSKCSQKSRYFVELGSADGLENNSANLAIVKKFSGVMVEGDPASSWRSSILQEFNMGVDHLNLFVRKDTMDELMAHVLEKSPDFLSIDIDGNDYWILQDFLQRGLQPKIICVEYNSTFGPSEAVTIPYQGDFYFRDAHPSCLYYGASVAAFRRLLEKEGYSFVTVDSNGVNAFFIRNENFPEDFCKNLKGLNFKDNFFDKKRFREDWSIRRKQIEHLPVEKIN